ncbi:unnamed protein product [Caretta caretta]
MHSQVLITLSSTVLEAAGEKQRYMTKRALFKSQLELVKKHMLIQNPELVQGLPRTSFWNLEKSHPPWEFDCLGTKRQDNYLLLLKTSYNSS